MTIVISQPFGLGDCIFTQTLVRRIADGRKIVWPVLPHFIEGLRRAYPDITWIDVNTCGFNLERKDQYEVMHAEYGACTVLPIRWSMEAMNVPYTQVMAAKYGMYGMDWRDWKEDAMWQRDKLKEGELIIKQASFEKISENEVVMAKFINRFFRSDMSGCADIRETGTEMCNLNGSSIFDWAELIQISPDIHTVSTSIIYMLELLDLKAPEIHLYPRKPDETDFRNIDYLLQKHKYVLHV